MSLKSRAALKSEKNSLFADNTTGDVSPEDVRLHTENLIDSMPNIVDDALATAYLAEVTLTSAQIKALFTTAIELIGAPTSSEVLDIISCVVYYNYGTVDYATNTDLYLSYGGLGSSYDLNTTAIDISGSASIIQKVPTDNNSQIPEGVIGQPVVVYAKTTNPTAGDGEVTISIVYRKVTIP